MKILVVADTHIRNGDTGNVLPVLERAVAIAAKHNAALVIAGDVFDVSRPHPKTLAAAARVFTLCPHTILLAGNHDRDSDAPGDNALAPMAFMGGVTVIDAPLALDGAVYVPPAPRGTSGDKFFASALKSSAPALVAVAHFGIAGPEANPAWLTPGTLTLDAAFDAMAASGVRLLLSGDWHGRKAYKRGEMTVVQIGALVPANRGETGEGFGFAYLVDTADASYRVFQIPGPRYYVTRDPIEAATLAQKPGARVTLRAPKGTACPEGVDFEPTSTTHDRKHIDARAEALIAGDDALIRTVNEMVCEDLREEVADTVRDLLARVGNAA